MSKPNIILITTDQQRFDTIQALGNQHIYTPHLNWLVDKGITFTRCYSDSPICMAARNTIMTGKHGYSTGLVSNSEAIRPMSDLPTLPGTLTANGYQTRAQGKMHFAPVRANYGFEHMELPIDYYREKNKDSMNGLPKAHGVGENEIEPVISTVNEQNSLTYWTVKRSIDFLETRDDSRPFFLWTSFAKPHPPFDPCANYWALYSGKNLPGPLYGDWSEDIATMPQGFLKSTYTLNNAYRMSPEQLLDVKRAYYACITQIDYTLGLMLARLREMNLMENTWIIFTSDHGDMMGDHHMGAKSVFFEGSAHIPMIICPPGKTWHVDDWAGSHCDQLVSLADVAPTVLDIAGIKEDNEMDGMNMLDLCTQKQPDRLFYGNCDHNYFAVIDGHYKYHWTSLGGDELLFDLGQDPMELKNLTASAEYAAVLERLRNCLISQLVKTAPEQVSNGQLISQPAPSGPRDVAKWPGFHSTAVELDVLH